jgi:eukaryotic-like serine/threonine-protein kinase
VTLSCPHCSHKVSLKEPKPGRYKPQCPKCGERFLLVVHADPAQPPTAQKLPTAGGEATLPPSAPTTKDAAKTVAAASVDQTAPFVPQSSATLPDAGLAATIAPAPLPRGIDETTADAFTVVRPDETVALAPQLATTADETIALAQPPASAPAGTASTLPTLGGYRLLRELGRGAMGAVYLAKQLSLDREVALKTIQGEWASNPIFIARFTREAYAAAQLTHHTVVQIYDLGVDRDVHYFSMEYVRGQSLDQFVKQQGKLDSSVALGYVLQAARGLQYAHSRGLVHRDVKPANLMLSEHGVVKVADLGLVKNVGEDDPPASAKPG